MYTKEIHEKVLVLEPKVTSLESRVSSLESEVSGIASKVDAIKAMLDSPVLGMQKMSSNLDDLMVKLDV